MGLAGRKVKQRIGHDPRNLTWSDDAARFGAAYLSKFGWNADSGAGLGVEGDGRPSHLKVAQKLDVLGIGAAHQRDPNGIAWKQNRDFERLLARLNGVEEEGAGAMKVDGFVRSGEEGVEVVEETITAVETVEEDPAEDTKEKKKRKKSKGEDGDATGKKRRKKSQVGIEETVASHVETAALTDATPAHTPTLGPPRGHRARFIRSKRLALTDAAAVAAVLGIAPSASSAPSVSASTSTSGDRTPAEGRLQPTELLTTSSKSVMDYFQEKLRAKASGARALPPAAATPEDDGGREAPRAGLGAPRARLADEDQDAPRTGLGAARALLGASTSSDSDKSAPRAGLGAPTFAASSSATVSFARASSSSTPSSLDSSDSPAVAAAADAVDALFEDVTAGAATLRKQQKRARKEARRAARAAAAHPDADASAPAADVPSGALELAAGNGAPAAVEGGEAAQKAAKRAKKEARRRAMADADAPSVDDADASPGPAQALVPAVDEEAARREAKRCRKEQRRLEKARLASEA